MTKNEDHPRHFSASRRDPDGASLPPAGGPLLLKEGKFKKII